MPIDSERKWKEKLKGWKFEKNMTANDMSALVAKHEKPKRDEGKETKFFHSGSEIKSEKFENFKKGKLSKSWISRLRRLVSDSLKLRPGIRKYLTKCTATPADITYHTPGPQIPFIPMEIEDTLILEQQPAEIEPLGYLTIADDLSGVSTGAKKSSHESGNITEEEILEYLPGPTYQSGERHMLIKTILLSSMLWSCPGRGLHTMDEESVIGLDDEILAPLVASDLIENHINGARIDYENCRTKSAIVKYLGAIILIVERQCCSEETFLEYLSEFLDLLEVVPGAYVSVLQQSPGRPIFRTPEYSGVFQLYQEVLTLLRNEFQPTTEVVARICHLFADLVTLYPEVSHRAETLYGVAINSYEKTRKFDHML
jgi:hypothetical protein